MEKSKEQKSASKAEKAEKESPENNETERKENDKKENTLNESTVNNQSKTIKNKKVVYLNQKVIVPPLFPDRLEYIRNLFDNEELGFIVKYAPIYNNSSTYELGRYFKNKLKYILEIASGILFYLYKTFRIQKNNQKNEENSEKSTDDILHSGVINSPEEICKLYKDLCAWGGVKIEIISGSIKKYGYKVGDSLSKHKWCYLNGGCDKNFLIDPYLAICETKEINEEEEKQIKPFYFLTPPEFFLENHIPDDEKYQFVKKTIKVSVFTKKPQTDTEDFYNNIFKYKIKLQNYPYPEIDCKDSEIIIKFMIDDMELDVECIYNGRKLPEDKASITDNNFRSRYEAKIIFPGNGEYKLIILGKRINTVSQKIPIFSFKINTKIVNIINHEEEKTKSPKKNVVLHIRSGSPQYQKTKIESSIERHLTKCSSDFDKKIKNKCYDNNGAYLFEPKTKILKIGQETKFRVRIKNAKSVVVIDGRKWNYLHHRDGDNFEGSFIIENESIVLCAMRNKNMFTEVFEFLAIKR